MLLLQIVLFSTTILFKCSQVHLLHILSIFPYQGRSHFIVYETLLKELVNRGHDVTVISHFPQKMPVVNYHDISIERKADVYDNWIPVQNPSYMKIIYLSMYLTYVGAKNCKILLSDERVQNLWKNERKFDLVITEQFNSDCALGLAHILGAPVVGITSTTLMPYHYSRFGVPQHPSFTPFQLLNGGTKPNVFQRLERTIFTTYYHYIVRVVSQRIEQYILGQYFDDVPPLEELGRNIKFLLLYEHFVLFAPYTLPTNVILVNGFHVADVNPLPLELRKFIDESMFGVVYISFGTMLRSSSIATEKLEAIIEAIQKLPQRIIWKWDSDSLPVKSKNIYVSRWLPQNDILAHPKVLAIFSHCGLLGLTEALHHGVPVIGMPVFGDQPRNAAAVEEIGLGVQIQVDELTKDILLEKLKIVLDPQFRNKVKWISKMWKDRPISAKDTAVYWLEYAARYHNVTFRTIAADVPLYQFFCLDIIFCFVIMSVASLFAIKYLISLYTSYRKTRALKNYSKNKSKKQ